jgi:hypothetical protein
MDRSALADPDEARTQLERNARPEHEAACLDRGHLRDSAPAKRIGEGLDSPDKEAAVGEQAEHVGVTVDPAEAGQEAIFEARHRLDCARTNAVGSRAKGRRSRALPGGRLTSGEASPHPSAAGSLLPAEEPLVAVALPRRDGDRG